jgi:hypothetical protein
MVLKTLDKVAKENFGGFFLIFQHGMRTLKKKGSTIYRRECARLQEEVGGIHPLDPLGVQLSTPVHLHHRVFEIDEKRKFREFNLLKCIFSCQGN